MSEPGTPLRMLEMIEKHGAIKIAHGHVWIGRGAIATENVWDDLKELSRDGHWEYDEVIFGDDDDAPVVEAKRWVGDWIPVPVRESARDD